MLSPHVDQLSERVLQRKLPLLGERPALRATAGLIAPPGYNVMRHEFDNGYVVRELSVAGSWLQLSAQ